MIFSRYMPRSGIAASYGYFIFSFLKISILFFIVAAPIYIPMNSVQFPFSIPSQALAICISHRARKRHNKENSTNCQNTERTPKLSNLNKMKRQRNTQQVKRKKKKKKQDKCPAIPTKEKDREST